jgi:hypothetical protein
VQKEILRATRMRFNDCLPAEKVGVFVYDKRGTGGSDGKYTQDFDTLADDAVAAMRGSEANCGHTLRPGRLPRWESGRLGRADRRNTGVCRFRYC